MEKSIFKKLEKYRAEIVNFKASLIRNTIYYYENSYLPELKEQTGNSPADYIHRYKRELENFLYDARTGTRLENLGISKTEILNFLRSEAIDYRQRASSHSENPYIKISSLRKAVTFAHLLIEIEKELEIYSLHWLCSRNPIQLN
jgi:hypothetical protein